MTRTTLQNLAFVAVAAALLGACTSSMNTCTQPEPMKPQYGDVDAK